jgi:stress-induced morphogen
VLSHVNGQTEDGNIFLDQQSNLLMALLSDGMAEELHALYFTYGTDQDGSPW